MADTTIQRCRHTMAWALIGHAWTGGGLSREHRHTALEGIWHPRACVCVVCVIMFCAFQVCALALAVTTFLPFVSE